MEIHIDKKDNEKELEEIKNRVEKVYPKRPIFPQIMKKIRKAYFKKKKKNPDITIPIVIAVIVNESKRNQRLFYGNVDITNDLIAYFDENKNLAFLAFELWKREVN